MNVKIEYELLHDNAFPPARNHEGDAGMDFYASGDYIISPFTYKVVSTGVTVRLPDEYNAIIKPKGKNNHLIGAGVIEHTYQGEILFKIFNTSTEALVLRHGDPIGQLILIPALSPEPVLGKDIHKVRTVRGNSGGIKSDYEKQILKELGL